jgi:hypothetical protein
VVVTVSAAAFFGVLLHFLVRRQPNVGFTVCVAVVFGFVLASTRAAPALQNILSGVTAALGVHS